MNWSDHQITACIVYRRTEDVCQASFEIEPFAMWFFFRKLGVVGGGAEQKSSAQGWMKRIEKYSGRQPTPLSPFQRNTSPPFIAEHRIYPLLPSLKLLHRAEPNFAPTIASFPAAPP